MEMLLDRLKKICEEQLVVKYPADDGTVRDRLGWELEAISMKHTESLFLQIVDVIREFDLPLYSFNYRGCLGNSLVAYLCGITETDSVKHGLMPYFFYGYNMEKEPDIDINMHPDIVTDVIKYVDGLDYTGDTDIKVDYRAHTTPVIMRKLHELTGVSPDSISTEDSDVMEMFICNGDKAPACIGLPEFPSTIMVDMLKEAAPKCFDDLVTMTGLMHGSSTWIDNARELIISGKTDLSGVIAFRDDVFGILTKCGCDQETAYTLADHVRRGKVHKGTSRKWLAFKNSSLNEGLPPWFVESCEKIEYLFPRGHGYTYMLNTWRMAWYRLHYKEIFEEIMALFFNRIK